MKQLRSYLLFVGIVILLYVYGSPYPAVAQTPANSTASTTQSPPKPTPEVQALLNKAVAAQEKSDFKETLRLAEEALALAKERKDRCGEGVALRRIGLAYGSLGKKDRSLDFTQQALSIAKEIGDR